MMKKRARLFACLLCVPLAQAAFGACKIAQVAELPVSVASNRPRLQGQINGQPVDILIDTGAASFVWEGAAKQLGLKMGGVQNLRMFGVGGEAIVHETVVNRLQIGAFTAKNLQMVVIYQNAPPRRGAPAMVLGEDFFSNFVTEFDLAHGVVRLLKPKDCQLDQLTYWSETYSEADLERADLYDPRILARVTLAGKQVSAMLDTGASTSMVARAVASTVGVTPWTDGKQAAVKMSGIAGVPIDSWVGTFPTFALGSESVRNVKLRISDMFAANKVIATGSHVGKVNEDAPGMLIGCDFFLAHRVLVLFKERKLLFTYNGGPIFQAVKSVDGGEGEVDDEH
jgi:predicted aspartyl protease